MGQLLLTALILSTLTLSNGKHYIKHCRNAPQGCIQSAEDMAVDFLRASEVYHLSPLLLVSIGVKETGLNPRRIGSRGERGAMQVMPAHLKGYDRTDDRFLILKATGILRSYIDWCGGSLRKGLGTYNAGMNLGKCPANTKYTRRVLRIQQSLTAKTVQLQE